MFRIGIDVGSTYTKYCVTRDGEIISLQAEKTQLRQRDYFEVKLAEFCSLYQDAETVACGYGKKTGKSPRLCDVLSTSGKRTKPIKR